MFHFDSAGPYDRSATLNSVSTIETLTGGFGADPQTGNSLNNTLTGRAGNELERNMPFRIELRIMMRSNSDSPRMSIVRLHQRLELLLDNPLWLT